MADNRYGNIGKEQFEEINRSAQLFKETVRETGKVLKDDFSKTVSIANTLSGLSGDILKNKNELKKVDGDLNDAAKELTQLRAQELNLQSQLLGASKEEKEELLKKLEAIQIRRDAMNSMVEDAKSLVTEAQKLASQTKFFDKLQAAAESIPGLGPLISGPFQKAAAAAKEAAEDGKGLLNTYLAGGKELLKVLGPAALLAAAIQASKETKELSTNLGISMESAREMQERFGQFAADSRDARINSTKLASAQNSLQKELGLGVEFSGETLSNFTKLTEYMGVSAKAAAQLVKLTQGLGVSSAEFQSNLAQSVTESSKALGLNMPLSEALETVGSASASTLINLRRSPQQLGKMVAEAKKLGLEFAQIENIASSMLDFESSIQAELEAEVLTGKQLNFERARMAALQGDQLTLTKEIASQVGTLSEFENMNVIARESLAKSMNMNVDQMSEMLLKSDALLANEEAAAGMSSKQLADARERAKVTGDLGAALLEVQQEASLTQKFQDATDKLVDAFKQIAIKITPVVDKLADLFSKFAASPLAKIAVTLAGAGGLAVAAAAALKSFRGISPFAPLFTKDVSLGGKGGGSLSSNMMRNFRGKRGLVQLRKLGRVAGPAAGLAAGGALVQLAGNHFADEFEKEGKIAAAQTTDMISGAGQGALYGAALGSIVPGIGTAAGAVVGGAIGLISGGVEAANRRAEETANKQEQTQDEFLKTMQEVAMKEAKIFLDSNKVGMGLTLGTNYKTQ